jgi:Arc/MetJ family transcription regulator
VTVTELAVLNVCRSHPENCFRGVHSANEAIMEVTLELDDELIEQAREYTGLTDISAIVQEALKALIEWEAVRRRSE